MRFATRDARPAIDVHGTALALSKKLNGFLWKSIAGNVEIQLKLGVLSKRNGVLIDLIKFVINKPLNIIFIYGFVF